MATNFLAVSFFPMLIIQLMSFGKDSNGEEANSERTSDLDWKSKKFPFRNISKSWDERVDDLVSRLTLKVSDSTQNNCKCTVDVV